MTLDIPQRPPLQAPIENFIQLTASGLLPAVQRVER